MKRVFLFLGTNLAVLVVLGFISHLIGVDRYLTQNGLNLAALLGFAAVFGFGGSFISLLMSKTIAKMSTGAQVIDSPSSSTEAWLLDTVQDLANRANLPMPEVAIYEGAPNAFATGASKNSSLVAVSTGLLQTMEKDEIRAVLAHEIAHVQNGDMVTLTLIQGVVNTFVIFISRVLAYAADAALNKRENGESAGRSGIYVAVSMLCEIVFGILASVIVAWFSRQREYRADAGAAYLMGSVKPMQKALARLGGLQTQALPDSLAAFGIAGGNLMALFASHPPLEARIEALNHLEIRNV